MSREVPMNRLWCLAAILVCVSLGQFALSQETKPVDGALAVQKSPPPSGATLKAAQKEVRTTFAADFKAAKTPDAKLTLARTLGQKASASQDDSAYAFGAEAIELYCECGHAIGAFKVIDDLALSFSIPVVAIKATAFKKAIKEAKLPAQKRIAALVGLKLAGEAAASEEYDVAKDVATQSLALARPSKDQSVVPRAMDHQTKYNEAAKNWAAVKKAKDQLKTNANDPEANEVVGRYECLTRQDWKQGLPLLKLGVDPELKAAAAMDLALTTDDGAQQAADAWWDLAEKQKKDRVQILPRCAYWIEKALPKLSGVAKVNAEKRLQEIYVAISGRNFEKILSTPPNGALGVGVANCADAMLPVTVQSGFKPEASWLLSFQVYTTEIPGGPHMVFSWSDGRPGRDMIMVGWNNDSFGFGIEDCVNGGGQGINLATPAAEYANRWIDVKIVHDVVAQEIEFYVDNRLIRKEPLTVITRPDQGMPVYLGGADGAGYRFLGQVRNLWFGNIK